VLLSSNRQTDSSVHVTDVTVWVVAGNASKEKVGLAVDTSPKAHNVVKKERIGSILIK